MRTKLFYVISLVLVAVVLSACVGAAAAQGITPTASTKAPVAQSTEESPSAPLRTITVSGTGKTSLTPDIAYVNIGVHTENKNATEAVSSNNTQAQKVIDALKKMGIAEKDIQTTNFSIYPQQQYDNQGKATGEINYVVDNSVYVTVRDLSKIGDLLDAAVSAGANSINGVQFDVSDQTEALASARKAAMADAQAQAAELASEAGVTLGPVQSITVAGGYQPPVPVYQAKGAGAVMEAASVPVSSGQMIVNVQVNVVYQIR